MYLVCYKLSISLAYPCFFMLLYELRRLYYIHEQVQIQDLKHF